MLDQAAEHEIVKPKPGMFVVTRTSCWCEDNPCEGSRPVSYLYVDRRTVDDPKKIPANKGTDGDWYERGENHRIEDGKIARDLGYRTVWVVELDGLEGLMEFLGTHGECVLKPPRDNMPCEIEIYDDYRE